jgi:hypothetical protein
MTLVTGLGTRVGFLAWQHRGESPVIMVRTLPEDTGESAPRVTMVPRTEWETGVGRCRLTLSNQSGKRPWFQCLKLEYDEPLSISAFKFSNLRRYTGGYWGDSGETADNLRMTFSKVGRCRTTVSNLVLKAPMVSTLETTI